MHRREFQTVAAEALNIAGKAIGEIQEKHLELVAKVQAQGEYMADLAVSRDALESRANSVTDLIIHVRQMTFMQRLKWLLFGADVVR